MTKAPKNPRVTLKKAESDVKKFDKQETYTLKDGNNINFDPFFSPAKVQALVDEYHGDIKGFKDANIPTDERFINDYMGFLIVKHFTEYGKYIESDLLFKMNAFDTLLNNGHLYEILSDVLTPSEIHKVWDEMTRTVATYQHLNGFNEKVDKEFKKLEIQNKDAFEQFSKQIQARNVLVDKERKADDRKAKAQAKKAETDGKE
ncbi:hypothetical protein ACI2JA_04125 [Alkalihalobacillus sp. NPDC078783]